MEFQLAVPDWACCEYCDRAFKIEMQLEAHQPICAEKWNKANPEKAGE